ncbi:MAG: ferrochelatase [Chloroflexi bacterium]|nr:ferrochelatase [Chloroflexota bacterium]
MTSGILLTNIGSPDAPTAKALRPYLAEFLGDPRIIELPRWLWLPILHSVILTTRPRRSALLYQNIWTDSGSPLLAIAQQQAAGLRERLAARTGSSIQVAIGMRYGNPSIASSLRQLRDSGVKRILVFPLFPQYSAATTASTFDAVFAELKTWRWMPELRTVNHYHDHPRYIAALANSIREYWQAHGKAERLLLSFHGIPKSYSLAGDPYAGECEMTARLVAAQLGLKEGEWQMSFQSRFGPVEWLQPYTDKLLEEWGKRGVRSVDALCPGFATDCLETIDEIGREARETFAKAGGGRLSYIPALNARPDHLDALAEVAMRQLEGWV